MTGHIRSIVPQRGGVSPIDNNTVFYAPFDEHPNDVLQGVKVAGNKYSMKFDTGRVNCGNSSAFNLTSGITIESWVYFTESVVKEMFMKSSYEFYQSGQSVVFRTNGSDMQSTGTIPLNTWTHIAATFNGAIKCIYINGALDKSVAYTTLISVSANPFVIGAYADGQYQYKGRFSDVRLWNVALSLNEIKKYMNEPPKQDGLVGWWKLDENDVTVAYDYSSNGNDGLIVGSNSLAEGRAIYSLVKGGYPGGVIQPQEATENMLPTVDLTDTSKWTHRTCTVTKTTEVASPNGYQVFKAIPTAADAAIAWATSMSSFPAGTYTMSAWMRAPEGQQHTLAWSTGHVASSTNPIIVTDQWKRFTLTQTSATVAGTYLHLVGGWGTWATGENLYISEPQVEAKPYATEFTPSKRSARQEYGSGVLVEEGTTNLITNPMINAIPTVGNTWGTYDASTQYNSNTSFSIGTIESVVDNIVTLNPVGHAIYTYDVLNADTTGGGVTAGTDYFIKKHSVNSFSLHAYDPSQDGSKGFRVHDSINNDIRVPINATSFPTMWHGNAHRPNAGIVKEIIPNGFSHEGRTHDCLRMYTNFRTGNTLYGYLAYGVTPPVTGGLTYTVSFYHRAVTPETVGRNIRPEFYTPGTAPYWTGIPTFQLTLEWKRYEYTGVATNTGAVTSYFNAGHGVVWEISEIQIEQKPFSTSFTDGVRGKGLLAYSSPLKGCAQFTISCWVKVSSDGSTTGNGKQPIIVIGNGPNLFWGRNLPSKSLGLFYGASWKIDPGNLILNVGEWYFVALVGNGTKVSMYYNGIFAGEANDFDMSIMSSANLIGVGCEAEYLEKRTVNGVLDEVRIDKIARTEAEILAWYYQGRNGW